MTTNEPPQDIAAEQATLGGMLLSPTAIKEVAELLMGSEFYRPAHELIFRAILELRDRGEPADAVTVAAELTERGELNRIGGAPYLHTLMSSVPTAASAGYYAVIVRDRYRRRAAIQHAYRVVDAMQPTTTDPDDLDDVFANLRLEFDDLAAGQQTTPLARQVAALTAELLDSEGLDTIPALRPLVDGFLYLDSVARINGPSGHMKSFVALDLAAHVGTGRPWRGHAVTQGLVIHLVAEGAAGLRRRVRAWEQYHGLRMRNVRFLPRPVQAGDAAAWAVLLEACRQLRPVFIIFDTQARITVGVEENSATEMGRVVARIDDLRTATGACVALIHHQGLQGDHGRGSTAVKGAMQTELRVTKKGTGADTRVTVTSDKQKDDEELDDVVFAVHVVKLDHEAKEDGSPATSVVLIPGAPMAEGGAQSGPAEKAGDVRKATVRVLEVLRGTPTPLTVTEIGDVLAVHEFGPLKQRTIQNALKTLSDEGAAEAAGARGFATLWQAATPREDQEGI